MLLGHSASFMNELPFLLILRLFGEDLTTSKFSPAPAKTACQDWSAPNRGKKEMYVQPDWLQMGGRVIPALLRLWKEDSSVVLFPRSGLDSHAAFSSGKWC